MKKLFAVFLAAVMVFTLIPSAAALGTVSSVNDQKRHTVCTALSESALAYYSDGYRYDRLASLSGAEDVTTGYTAMQNNELFAALQTLMADTHQYYSSYSGYKKGSLAYFWLNTDAVESSDTYVMFYSDVSAGDEGIKLNREHIWPKSRASFVTSNGGSDLHHLRPAVDTVNNAKSDHLFGNITGVYEDGYTAGSVGGTVCYWVKKDADLFECKDDVKGDVARILLYVYCRWEQPNLYTDIAPELLPENEKDGTNSGKRVIESLDTLLDWCEEDPVDTWEMRRNDLIEEVQGNRNVFIDYPELAWQLFGKELPSDMSTPSSGGSRLLLGDADGDGGVTIVDATMIQRALAGLQTTVFLPEAADVNRDGETGIDDATCIQRHLAGIPTYASGIGEPIQHS